MINLRDNIWAVEVPEDARNIGIVKGRIISYQSVGGETIDLPPGTWKILCTTKDATIDQAQQIVEQQDDGFRNYNEDDFHYDLPLMSPFDSLRSLLEAKGLRGKNYCILLKGKDG